MRKMMVSSNATAVANEHQIQGSIQSSIQNILRTVSQWVSAGSGWQIDKITGHELIF